MLVVVYQNLHNSLRVVNGKSATAVDVVVDDASEAYTNLTGASIVIINHTPKCLLMKLLDPKHSPLPELGNGILPSYPQSVSIEVKIATSNLEAASTILQLQTINRMDILLRIFFSI